MSRSTSSASTSRSRSFSTSPSPSIATTPGTGSTPETQSLSEELEVPYARRRASDFQSRTLHKVFDSKPYPSREERSALADEVGMDYKSITVWFQNKRQSEKRKAWTRNDRAKKRAEAQLAAAIYRGELPKPPPSNPLISLDRIASLSERPSDPPTSIRTPLTPKKRRTAEDCSPPGRSPCDLWMHMPSSPMQTPSSPAENTRLLLAPTLTKPRKSLEWACTKARVSEKSYRRGKENTGSRRSSRVLRRPVYISGDTDVEGSDTEVEPDEAVTPSGSLLSIPIPSLFSGSGEDDGEETVRSKTNDKSRPADVEAAMVLLGFQKGQ
ncbi:homeobox domain-containing protein [Amylostereum chailletii]|nr:homeobox domain-containing protein [Amylostereum chailletii]